MLIIVYAVLLLLSFFFGVVYSAWIIRALWRCQWRKVARLALELLVIAAVLGAVLWGCQMQGFREWEQKTFGMPVHLTKIVFHFESERSLTGDGQSVEVYELPEMLRDRFATVDVRLLEEFPQPPLARGTWKSERWRRTPLDPAHKNLLGFALSPTYDNEPVAAIFAEVRDILARPGAFYSFLHNGNIGRMESVELLVVDVSKGRLYRIRMDT